MKKKIIISFVSAACILAACGDKVKRTPGRVYMPDMAYSRAYETYSVTEEQKKEWEKQGMYYTGMPVPGTIKRGVDFTFRLAKDKTGDTLNYVASKQIKSPIAASDSSFMHEAARLYLVNCGICHGTAIDGNGPLFKNGDGPYPAKPANLASDPKYTSMPEGQMFYSITYGKNMMGSYASQLNSTQRWEVIAYIKSKQASASKTSAAAGSSTTTVVTAGAASSSGAKKDSTGKK
jgi:mono/diheme cytochrome c family protein